ncbi:MAG: MATE family efflux transporter [Acidaminococcaceae bacterium]|nr:MATE family efflux transporter [Acidaminococcaceae bacterium]
MDKTDFTEGKIIGPLLRFVFPIMFAIFLQIFYGAVDLLIVGKFSDAVNVSAVSTGSQLMHSVTIILTDLALGTTVLLGIFLGQKNSEECGRVIGATVALFFSIGAAVSVLFLCCAEPLAALMNAPTEAFVQTASYIRICGGGSVFIVAYNVLGSIFRGIGNARLPLFTVAVATVFNIAGDYLMVAVFHMGATGAAIATVFAQAVSVLCSVLLIKRLGLDLSFSVSDIGFHKTLIRRIVSLGLPIALQDLLVGISFLIILAIVNRYGVITSAGVGVAEKLCGFFLLAPIAFSQGISSFVAQNYGAGKMDRARKALRYGISISLSCGVVLGYLAFFHSVPLSSIFSDEATVCRASGEYLKAFSFDCLLTAFLFCFMGFFNGCARTRFVMLQGIAGAFLVRVPLSYLFSSWYGGNIFILGLATPASSFVQVLLCIIYFIKFKREKTFKI